MSTPQMPREYPVLRRPPQDRFAPVAATIALLAISAAFILAILYGSIATYNSLTRQPTLVEAPPSLYGLDAETAPETRMDRQDVRMTTIPVRNRDRTALLLYVHNHITAHGGTLISAYTCPEGDDTPQHDDPSHDTPGNGNTYHVNAQYLKMLAPLSSPPRNQPLAYAQWAQDPPRDPEMRNQLPDTYVRISTRYTWFEEPRNRTLAIYAASIIAGLTAASIGLAIRASQPLPEPSNE